MTREIYVFSSIVKKNTCLSSRPCGEISMQINNNYKISNLSFEKKEISRLRLRCTRNDNLYHAFSLQITLKN